MDRDEVLALTRVEAEPAVSVLLPLQRSAFNHDAELLRAAELVDEACDIVERSYPARSADAVVHRLHEARDHLDLSHPEDGLAMFISAEEEHVFSVPFPIQEQLCVETTFATRQLLVGLAREPRVRILVVSEHQARLFEDREGELVEINDAGFPLATTAPHELDTPHRDLPIHEEAEAEEHRIVYRAVDDALDRLHVHRTMPLVLVGAERELAYFNEVSHHRTLIIGRVRGNYLHAEPADLERVVRRVIDAHVAALQAAAVHDVLEKVGTNQVVTGFARAWGAACEGRGHRLVIERNFVLPVHLTNGLLAGQTSDETRALDDVIDLLIERVVRTGGTVVFAEAGMLSEVGRVALELRY